MTNVLFLDCEFTDLLQPELLSLGIVSATGDEYYVELDLDAPSSAAILAGASDFVRHNGVLDQWGRVPGAAASRQLMAERTAAWLLEHIGRFGRPVSIAHDYATDYELLVELLQEAEHWPAPPGAVRPFNVNLATSSVTADLAAEKCFLALRPRGLARHHALADALALRAAFFARSAQ